MMVTITLSAMPFPLYEFEPNAETVLDALLPLVDVAGE